MISKWFELKNNAIKLRKKGLSIGFIERKLNIPRSTLSGWFKEIILTDQQKNRLKERAKFALMRSRQKAIKWHKKQKEANIAKAESQADLVLEKIDLNNKETIELALSFLYLGEGAKKSTTSLGSSDPKIITFFISCIEKLYGLSRKSAKCELHLRYDQDEKETIKFWSAELGIPERNFIYSKDIRTINSTTRPDYRGVCAIRIGGIAIQRRLMFLSRKFCNIISSMND